MRILLFLLLSATATSAAPPGITKADRPVPTPWIEIKADPVLTVLQATEKSRWSLIDSQSADLVPADDGKTAVFAAAVKGRYRVTAVAPTGEVSQVIVIVGDTTPPTPPAPQDPLLLKLQAAASLDTRTDRASDLADLVELYAQAAVLAKDVKIVSLGDLVARVRDASKILVVSGFPDLKRVIAGELSAAFPDDVPLDEATRATAANLFLKLSSALKGVK